MMRLWDLTRAASGWPIDPARVEAMMLAADDVLLDGRRHRDELDADQVIHLVGHWEAIMQRQARDRPRSPHTEG